MIGGKVIETIVLDNRVWLNCQDYDKVTDHLRSGTCAVYVEKTPESCSVSEGDIIWWSGGQVMWTAKDHNHRTIGKPDTKLKRIGFSGVSRPIPAPRAVESGVAPAASS